MLYQAVALGVIAYLPGAILFRAPIADRWRRAALRAEERAFWAVFISLSLSSTVALGLAAAEQYTFERLLAANLAVCLAVALLARGRLQLDTDAPRPGLTALAPLVLIGLGLWLYFPSAEYIIGGKDPGVYMNEGVQIAQRGTLVTHDPQIESLPPSSQDLFISRRDNDAYYGIRFMGYFVTDPSAGTVVAQFPHLYPVWIAIGYGIHGLTGARQVIGIWAILGVLALYFVGTRAVGTLPALAGATLLAVHVAQVWFSRYPNSELVLQAMLFAALLAFARSHVDGDRFFGPVAATLLGLSLFVRLPAVLAWAAVGGASLAGVFEGRRLRLSFIAPAVLWLGLATWYFLAILAPYAQQPIGFVRNLQTIHLVLIGFSVAGLAALIAASRSERLRVEVRRWLPVAISGVVILAATYAYFLRTPGGRLAAHRRARPSDLCGVLPVALRPRRGAGRIRAARPALVLAKPGVDSVRRRIFTVLLLQDPGGTGALLDGEAVSPRHPADVDAADRHGGLLGNRSAVAEARGKSKLGPSAGWSSVWHSLGSSASSTWRRHARFSAMSSTPASSRAWRSWRTGSMTRRCSSSSPERHQTSTCWRSRSPTSMPGTCWFSATHGPTSSPFSSS